MKCKASAAHRGRQGCITRVKVCRAGVFSQGEGVRRAEKRSKGRGELRVGAADRVSSPTLEESYRAGACRSAITCFNSEWVLSSCINHPL